MRRFALNSSNNPHFHPDSELYILPVPPIQNLPGSLILKELKDTRHLYLKDQWFQYDFSLPLKLVDYILCLLDQMTPSLDGETESIMKHGSILLFVSFFTSQS